MGVSRYQAAGALACKLKHALRDREGSDLGTVVPKGRKVVTRKQTKNVLQGDWSHVQILRPAVHCPHCSWIHMSSLTLLSIPTHVYVRCPSPPLVCLGPLCSVGSGTEVLPSHRPSLLFPMERLVVRQGSPGDCVCKT